VRDHEDGRGRGQRPRQQVKSTEVRAPSREAGDDTTGKVDLEAAIPVSSFAVTGQAAATAAERGRRRQQRQTQIEMGWADSGEGVK